MKDLTRILGRDLGQPTLKAQRPALGVIVELGMTSFDGEVLLGLELVLALAVERWDVRKDVALGSQVRLWIALPMMMAWEGELDCDQLGEGKIEFIGKEGFGERDLGRELK